MREADQVLLTCIARRGEKVGDFSSSSSAAPNATALDAAKLLVLERCKLCQVMFHDYSVESMKRRVEKLPGVDVAISAQVYGDVEFASLFSILQECRPKLGQQFVDLGHGSGKGLVGAFVMFGDVFERIYGIELLNELHSEAQLRISQLRQSIELSQEHLRPFWDATLHGRSLEDTVVAVEGDFLELSDWISAGLSTLVSYAPNVHVCNPVYNVSDIVLANSTCFGLGTMQKLSKLAESMKQDSIVVTFTLPLQSTQFDMFLQRNYIMSWGIATVNFHRRK